MKRSISLVLIVLFALAMATPAEAAVKSSSRTAPKRLITPTATPTPTLTIKRNISNEAIHHNQVTQLPPAFMNTSTPVSANASGKFYQVSTSIKHMITNVYVIDMKACLTSSKTKTIEDKCSCIVHLDPKNKIESGVTFEEIGRQIVECVQNSK